MGSHIYILTHAEARRRASEAISNAPDGYIITISPPKRSGDQNAALHALFSDIAKRCTWIGKRWDIEIWKRLLTAAWCRAEGEPVTMLPALDGHGIDIVFRRTSSLTKAECSSLLEFVNAWAAEHPEFVKAEA